MEFALLDGIRSKPTPNQKAICPTCRTEVIAKCGQVNIWHWAHKVKDCDPWSEPESEWHRKWKLEVEEKHREVTIGTHRADIVGKNGTVIELQHSSINPQEIVERETFYKNMIWLIDAEPFHKNLWFRQNDNYWTFRWNWPRKYVQHMKKPCFLDISMYIDYEIKNAKERLSYYVEAQREKDYYTDDIQREQTEVMKYSVMSKTSIFHIKKIHASGNGWGVFLTKQDFIKKYFAP